MVGVCVGVSLGVCVGVCVDVSLGVCVGVSVGVCVGVEVTALTEQNSTWVQFPLQIEYVYAVVGQVYPDDDGGCPICCTKSKEA